MDLVTIVSIYAAIGVLILLGGALADPVSRRAIGEAAVWSVIFAVLWPAFLLLVACYYVDECRHG